MQAALGGHNLSPLSPCTHADFLLEAEARLGPCVWGRGELPSAPRAMGGASLGPGREGAPELLGRVGTLP